MEFMAMKEARHKVYTVQNSFYPSQFFVQAGRYFVREGDLVKHSNTKDTKWKYHFFLFSDSIAYGQQIFNGYYKFHRHVTVIGVTDLVECCNDEYRELQFIIKSSEKNLKLQAETPAQKKQWMEALDGIVKNNKRTKGNEMAIPPGPTPTKSRRSSSSRRFSVNLAPSWKRF